MDKVKRWFIFLLFPVAINIIVSAYIAVSKPLPDFVGYFSGSLIGAVLIYFWFWEIVKAASKGTIELLKIMGWGFLVKIILILLVIIGGRFFDQFNQFYFVFAFLVSVMSAMAIEIFYFYSLNLKKQ